VIQQAQTDSVANCWKTTSNHSVLEIRISNLQTWMEELPQWWNKYDQERKSIRHLVTFRTQVLYQVFFLLYIINKILWSQQENGNFGFSSQYMYYLH